MFDTTQVWVAIITVGGGLATLIVQGIFAERGRRDIKTKLNEVHSLANATATAGLAREASQAKVIEGLQQDKKDAALAVVAAARQPPTVIDP